MFISILCPLNPVSLDYHRNTVYQDIESIFSHLQNRSDISCSVVSKQQSKQYIIVNSTLQKTVHNSNTTHYTLQITVHMQKQGKDRTISLSEKERKFSLPEKERRLEERKGSLEKERRMDEEKVEGRRLVSSFNSLINEDNCLRLALTSQVKKGLFRISCKD